MLVILFEYFFHQPYLPGFYFKTFLLLFVEFLYIIKLRVTAKNFLHAQLVEGVSWVHDSSEQTKWLRMHEFERESILLNSYFCCGM